MVFLVATIKGIDYLHNRGLTFAKSKPYHIKRANLKVAKIWVKVIEI